MWEEVTQCVLSKVIVDKKKGEMQVLIKRWKDSVKLDEFTESDEIKRKSRAKRMLGHRLESVFSWDWVYERDGEKGKERKNIT